MPQMQAWLWMLWTVAVIYCVIWLGATLQLVSVEPFLGGLLLGWLLGGATVVLLMRL